MSGRFFGAKTNPQGLGGKGFFGPAKAVGVAPPACSQQLIQAGNSGGTDFPGSSGVANPIIGWFGNNDGNPNEAGLWGINVAGQAAFLPGGTYGYGDAVAAVRVPTASPCFVVYQAGLQNQNAFVSVTVNGHTYSTATVPYFDNGGGCGPTYWIWTNTPSGMVAGQQYCVVFDSGIAVTGFTAHFGTSTLVTTPGSPLVNGQQLNGISVDGSGNLNVNIAGALAQSFFNTVTFTHDIFGSLAYASAAATFAHVGPNSIWTWAGQSFDSTQVGGFVQFS